jgi:hypothetical protein
LINWNNETMTAELFESALGITDPWFVTSVKFDETAPLEDTFLAELMDKAGLLQVGCAHLRFRGLRTQCKGSGAPKASLKDLKSPTCRPPCASV